MKTPLRTALMSSAMLAASWMSGGALAAACAGASPFADVAPSDGFCTNTEWMKNRAITVGCGNGTIYCPLDVVTRASMALFMNRLGVALTPEIKTVFLLNDSSVSPIGVTPFCATTDFAAANYPRQAVITASFTGAVAANTTAIADVVHSSNGGGTWNFTSPGVSFRVSGAAGTWASGTHATSHLIPAGASLRYALSVDGGTYSQNRCFLVVQMLNANGTSTPFDESRNAPAGLRNEEP